MKKLISLLLLICCVSGIHAQILQPEQAALIDNRDIVAEAISESNLLIQQINQIDNASVKAEQQLDFNNRVIINQNGNNHTTRVVQNGNGNEARLLSEGSLTKTNVNQNGNNNYVFSNLSNNTTQLYSAVLQQNGDDNNIELNLLGNNVIPGIDRMVSVTQTGNDLIFTGTYDSPDQPISVEQTSGTGRAGMSVSVSTSAFYFPMKQ